MKVLVAGASGAVGKTLLPALLKRGHSVIGLVRSARSSLQVSEQGASPIVVDALDRQAVIDAFRRVKPDVVIHQLTALPQKTDLRDFDGVFRQTNLLRTEGTDNLIAGAREVGVRRFVAQSFCGWPYARVGGPVKTEDDPLDPNPLPAFRKTLEAIQYLEKAVSAAHDIAGVSLRYGPFYGPGTFLSRGGSMVDDVMRRRFPVVGSGGGVWSFIHTVDVASATIAAIESDVTGTFNVVDDEPAAVKEWLPGLAAALGAKPPYRVPAFVARMILPKHLYLMMTDVRGGSNAKFKKMFSWQPQFSSWRDGFKSGLS